MSVFFFPARWGAHEAGASLGRSTRSLGESINHGLVHGMRYLGVSIGDGLMGIGLGIGVGLMGIGLGIGVGLIGAAIIITGKMK